jgi:RNA polymerase sigma-70 factor (ECF subfamily)
MFRILRNLWIDHVRRMKTERRTEDSMSAQELAREEGEATVMSKLTLAEVQRAIDELPDEQREVLVLICVEDLAYREAAEVIGVPIGTVMSRLSRARSRLISLTEAAERQANKC